MASTYNGYNYTPQPTTGSGAFGSVPGTTAMPPSVWEQLNQNIPNYSAMTNSATGNISDMLAGKISPATSQNIWNSAAARGVSLGQPNSQIGNMIGLNLTGQTTEGLQQQGLQDYNTFTGTAGSLQQNPSLMAEISQSNANLAAAPSPEAAANYAKSLYDQYMKSVNPATGTSLTFTPQSNPYSQFSDFGGGGYGGGNSSYQNYLNLVAQNSGW
jgi:hypothetical protein